MKEATRSRQAETSGPGTFPKCYGLPVDLRNLIEDQPVELSRDSGSGRALLEGRVIQINDIEADAEYTHVSRGTGAFRTLWFARRLWSAERRGLCWLRVDMSRVSSTRRPATNAATGSTTTWNPIRRAVWTPPRRNPELVARLGSLDETPFPRNEPCAGSTGERQI